MYHLCSSVQLDLCQNSNLILATCSDDLGMGNQLAIKDCQISAFANPDKNYPIKLVRFNSGSGWKSPTRGEIFYQFRYMTIILGQLTTVTKLVLQLIDITNKILIIQLFGTMDGNAFYLHEEVRVSNCFRLRSLGFIFKS